MLTSILTSMLSRRPRGWGLTRIRRSRRMSLKASLRRCTGGLLAWQGVVGKHQIKIDRELRHVAHEEVDCRAAFQREGVVNEHERRDARQQPGAVEIDLVHGFNTRSSSPERDTPSVLKRD
jgi:hypothetical protein